MRKSLKTIPALLLAGIFLCVSCLPAQAQSLESAPPIQLTAPSYLLADAETGAIIFEKDADTPRQVASLTKLMTVLLVLERLDRGEISLDDTVAVSKTAASAPGSTALLDAGASYRVADLLRSAIVASGNDSATALAEHLAGSEQAFVQLMNARAAELGMKDTVYVNCTGLPAAGQQTTARDILRVSCEICRHPAYFNYSSLWLSNLTHPSGRVTDLTNTNRLVRFYADCDGLKTGSTNEAKYCVSATAQRSGMRLIAIVLGAPASQTRFNEARAMMDYGFATYRRTQVIAAGELTGYAIPVRRGAQDTAPIAVGKGLSMLLRAGQADKLSVELNLPESIEAPQMAGTRVGDVRVLLDGQAVAELPAVLAQDVRLPGFLEGLLLMLDHWR